MQFLILLGEARADDYGDRVLRHNLVEERDTIHAGHFNIERYDVGHLVQDTISGNVGLMPFTTLDLAVARKDLSEGLAYYCRIVDNQNTYFFASYRSSFFLITPCCVTLTASLVPANLLFYIRAVLRRFKNITGVRVKTILRPRASTSDVSNMSPSLARSVRQQ
jgi:hypothetical protein